MVRTMKIVAETVTNALGSLNGWLCVQTVMCVCK